MKLQINNPKQALNKAYLKEKVSRESIDLFKQNLLTLFGSLSHKGDEEHLKSQVTYFLRDTWYRNAHQISPIEKKDLAIHTGKSVDDPAGVIIEVKSMTNRQEMITEAKPNVKAFHELVLYYFRERLDRNNNEIKYLIATNIGDWFIFDANEFDKKIFRNSGIRRLYDLKKSDTKDNPFFYEELQRLLDSEEITLESSWFNLLNYEKVVINKDNRDDQKLIALYKTLSPVHLLKLPFANDNNTLDKGFYEELLHIIGLEEVKESNKKIIKRQQKRQAATLIENTVIKLKDSEKFSDTAPLVDGKPDEKYLFKVALELTITWINRILFLKLLEAQLIKYHHGNTNYSFLNKMVIHDFDELSNLFFQVLAEKPSDRHDHLKSKYKNVPYLNSSLFDRTDLEKATFEIRGLDNGLELDLHAETVLKDSKGKRRKGKMKTLDYVFSFLDAYDFTSEGSEQIQEENKNLISASVLGLIFEKINGYKDGSFFTPGFVTMFICREAIRSKVIEKFNSRYDIDCGSFDDLKNFVGGRYRTADILEFNQLINELRICDPAVGSGHFLVSALNEIICLKAELGILADKDGVRLNGYEVKIENDELIITLHNNTDIFEYSISGSYVSPEVQRVQQIIFHEKELIIEDCLFGVDINENSVKICRLRLWIELLKNTYYTEKSGFKELETLPNIDINIKCGNSLVSRFEVKDDVFEKVPNFIKKLEDYRYWVKKYKITDDKKIKRELSDNIRLFVEEFKKRDPRVLEYEKKLVARQEEHYLKFGGSQLFNQELSSQQQSLKEKLEKEISRLKTGIEEIRNDVVYRDAFEWRFEFPEVLDEQGDFRGFDILIGNPPWGADIDKEQLVLVKRQHKDIIVRMVDSFMFFINKALNLKNNDGVISMIVPDVLLYQVDNEKLREKMLDTSQVGLVINLGDNIFEDVARASSIFMVSSRPATFTRVGNYRKKSGISLDKVLFERVNTSLFSKLPYHILATENIEGYELLSRLPSTTLESLIDDDGIQRGVSPDYKEAFIVDEEKVKEYKLERKKIKKTVTGGVDVKRYLISGKTKRLIYTSYQDQQEDIPNIIHYISSFRGKITCKEVKDGKHPFYALHRAREEKIFLKERKIIGVITADKIITALDEEKLYPTDGLYLFGTSTFIDPRFLIAVLNSKVATYVYRLFSFEEGRALAQVKPSILKDLPVPSVSLQEQQPFIKMVEFMETLLGSATERLLAHTSNERIAANLDDVLNMMVLELYFPDHFREQDLDILSFVKEAISQKSTNTDTILEFYLWLQQPDNAVRNRIIAANIKSPDLVARINAFSITVS